MKKEIYTLKTDFSMKPKLIHKQLARTCPNEPTPKVSQVRNILRDQIATLIPPTISYGQLHDWCKSEMNTPQNIDEPFVLNHFHTIEPEETFAFAVSTLRLLHNTMNRENVCTDGTYKFMWQGFPLIVIGFLDRTQRFHVICIAVTARETIAEYSFVFKAVKDSVHKHTGGVFHPKVLISDAAPAIRNAFYATLESAEQNVVCYIHVQRNISKRPYNSKSNKEQIMKDFLIIQTSASEIEFDRACDLFLKKWTAAEPEFCRYFKSEWMQKGTKNWYNGYSPFVPAHNNAQEGFNLHLKRDHSLRERLPFNTFKIALKAMILDLSERYEPSNPTGEIKKIRELPDITNQMFEAAHAWYSNSNTIIGEMNDETGGDSTTQKFIAASSKYLSQAKNPSLNDLIAIENKNFEHFDEYIQDGFAMQYNVQMKNDASTCFLESTCMCKSFHQSFICKHIIGLAFHLNLKKVPKGANSKLISKKRPRGRTATAKGALTKQ